jgi:hypothetical protein
MLRGTSTKSLFVMAVGVTITACTTDNVTFFEGTSPINVIQLNELTEQFFVPSPFTYTQDVHYDFRPDSFTSPRVLLKAFGGTFDASGTFTRNGCTLAQPLQSVTPTSRDGDLHFTGSFTLPATAACLAATGVSLEASIASGSTELASDEFIYRIK